MTATAGARSADAVRGRGQQFVFPVVVALVAGLVGYSLHQPSSGGPKWFSGMVEHANASSSSGCIKPDNNGELVCGSLYLKGGSSIHDGEAVTAAKLSLRAGKGIYVNAVLVYLPNDAG